MPKKREAWGSWNYIGTTGEVTSGESKPVFVTYWLNQLQNLPTEKMVGESGWVRVGQWVRGGPLCLIFYVCTTT